MAVLEVVVAVFLGELEAQGTPPPHLLHQIQTQHKGVMVGQDILEQNLITVVVVVVQALPVKVILNLLLVVTDQLLPSQDRL
jgi:hypothetical protein